MRDKTAWSTQDEYDAIDCIASDVGNYETSSHKKAIPKYERVAKLRGYIKSCENRFFWGNVVKHKAINYAQQTLASI